MEHCTDRPALLPWASVGAWLSSGPLDVRFSVECCCLVTHLCCSCVSSLITVAPRVACSSELAGRGGGYGSSPCVGAWALAHPEDTELCLLSQMPLRTPYWPRLSVIPVPPCDPCLDLLHRQVNKIKTFLISI